MERPRRAPAINRVIADVKKEDVRVKIFGTVAEIKDNSIILEDETGKIKIGTDKKLKIGDKIMIFGRPIQTNNGLELDSEIIQNMDLLNEKLYKKTYTLLKKEVHR